MEKLIVALLFLSFVADQLMQPEVVMHDKHKSFTALGMHCFFYGFVVFFFTIAMQILFPMSHVIWIAPIMIPVHFLIEFVCGTFAGMFYDKSLRRSYIFVTMLEHLLVNISLLVLFFYLLKP